MFARRLRPETWCWCCIVESKDNILRHQLPYRQSFNSECYENTLKAALRNAFGENAPEFLLNHGFCFQTMQGYIRKNFVFSIIQRWWSICRTPALKFRLAPCEFWSFPTFEWEIQRQMLGFFGSEVIQGTAATLWKVSENVLEKWASPYTLSPGNTVYTLLLDLKKFAHVWGFMKFIWRLWVSPQARSAYFYRTDIYLRQNPLIISCSNLLYLLRYIWTKNRLNCLMKVAPRTPNNYERNCRYLSEGKNEYG